MQFVTPQKASAPIIRTLLILPALILAGCGGGGGGSSSSASTPGSSAGNTSPAATVTVEGVAMKGTIANGLVSVYGVDQHAGHHQISEKPLAEAVRTNADGSFRIQIKEAVADSLVVRVTADARTTMTCDVTEGCESANGNSVKFGDAMTLPSDFQMFSAVIRNGTLNQPVHITPLTNMAYEWAAARVDGLSEYNIDNGRKLVATSLDLPEHILDQKPVDLTRLKDDQSVDSNLLDYSILSASFLSLAQGHQWNGISDVLNTASQQFAINSDLRNLTPTANSLPEISKYDLFTTAAKLAEGVAEKVRTSVQAPSRTGLNTVLASIATKARQQSRGLQSGQTEVVQPVSITYPSSATTRDAQVGESITLNVNATGGGKLTYQWRKNGEIIPGATGSTLTIASASTDDAGRYDCIVSNAANSVKTSTITIKLQNSAIALGWNTPDKRLDDTDLHPSQLKGYRILYGTSEDKMDQQVVINDGWATGYTFDNLGNNTWYFSIVAIDEEGRESPMSNIVEATL